MPDLLEAAAATELACDVGSLTAALHAVEAAVPQRSPKPVLQNVRLDADPERGTTLTATNLEVAVRVRLVGVKAPRPVSVLLPPPRLAAILAGARGRGDDLTLAVTDTASGPSGRISGRGFTFNLPLEDPSTYPTPDLEPREGGWSAAVPAASLRRLVRLTAFATDEESQRFALGGCLLEPLAGAVALVGTDGRRLARAEAEAEVTGAPPEGVTPVLPVKALRLLDRLLDDEDPAVKLSYDKNMLYAGTERFALCGRLVEGRFPRYRDVIPAPGPTRAACTAGALLWAARQSAVATSEESRGVGFSFAPERTVLNAEAADRGSGVVEAEVAVTGPPVVLTLDPRYLVDALGALEPEAGLTAVLGDEKTAVVLTLDPPRAPDPPEGGAPPVPPPPAVKFTYVVMPLTRARPPAPAPPPRG